MYIYISTIIVEEFLVYTKHSLSVASPSLFVLFFTMFFKFSSPTLRLLRPSVRLLLTEIAHSSEEEQRTEECS